MRLDKTKQMRTIFVWIQDLILGKELVLHITLPISPDTQHPWKWLTMTHFILPQDIFCSLLLYAFNFSSPVIVIFFKKVLFLSCLSRELQMETPKCQLLSNAIEDKCSISETLMVGELDYFKSEFRFGIS